MKYICPQSLSLQGFLLAFVWFGLLMVIGTMGDKDCSHEVHESFVGEWVNSTISAVGSESPECVFNFTKDLTEKLRFLLDVTDARINLTLEVSTNANTSLPLIFTIRQREHYKVVRLPFTYTQDLGSLSKKDAEDVKWFYTAGGTLCLDPRNSYDGRLLITVETDFGNHDVDFWIRLDVVPGLKLVLSDRENASGIVMTQLLSPMVSIFYRFNFSDPINKEVTNLTIITKVAGEFAPCTVVSTQNPYCPIQDTQQTIFYEGRTNTMLNVSVIHIHRDELTMRKDDYSVGFALVIVVFDDDTRCRGDYEYNRSEAKAIPRETIFSIQVVASTWDDTSTSKGFWAWNFLLFLGVYVLAAVAILVPVVVNKCSLKREIIPRLLPPIPAAPGGGGGQGGALMYQRELILSEYLVTEEDKAKSGHFFADTTIANVHYFLAVVCSNIGFRIWTLSETSDLTDCYYNKLCTYHIEFLTLKLFMGNAFVTSFFFTAFGFMYGLFIFCRKDKFDPLNVVPQPQLNLQIADSDLDLEAQGDTQTLVPRNKSNTKDYGSTAAAQNNTEASSSGVSAKSKGKLIPKVMVSSACQTDCDDYDSKFGIPQSLGLDKALAVLVFLEGLVSAMYHVCPNVGSYHIDAPILDLIAILAWIKVHQLRYPTYMTTVATTILAIGYTIFEFFIIMGNFAHNQGHWVLITALSLFVSLYVILMGLHGFYVYYLGHFRVVTRRPSQAGGVQNPRIALTLCGKIRTWWDRFWCGDEFPGTDRPRIVLNLYEMIRIWFRSGEGFSWTDRPLDLISVFIIVGSNWGIIVYDLANHFIHLNDGHAHMGSEVIASGRDKEFSEIILVNIHSSIQLILAFHWIRKFHYEGFHRRDISSLIFYLAHILLYWLPKYLGVDDPLFDWNLTPAESRILNRDCVDGVYDLHDYYHLCMSANLFFLCMTLTTINDSCTYMKRKHIRVF